MLVVLDLETDGLDPFKNDILEVGAILLDHKEHGMRFLEWCCTRARRTAEDGVDPFVVEMHTKNGLWRDCMQKGIALAFVDGLLEDELRRAGARDKSVILLGHSVHFDKGFIDAQMPRTSRLLSHRLLDIGAFARFLRAMGVVIPDTKEMPHRALPDCYLELNHYHDTKAAVKELAASVAVGPDPRTW